MLDGAEGRDPLETLPEESIEDLYENAPAGYLSTLENGSIVRVNRTLANWLGYEAEELVGRKKLLDLLAPGARIYYETHYAPLLKMQGAVREIAVELVRADGTRLPVLLNSTLVPGEDGAPTIIRTTAFDASDRRRYEQELLRARVEAEERARAALALAHVNEGVVLVGVDGLVDAVNAAAVEILGLDETGCLGKPVHESLPGWEEFAAHVPVGGPGERTPPSTLPLVRDGREQWLEVAGIDSGEGVVYTIRDITSEHALEQLRSDLAAIVSHELRTPLTGALGAAQTLQSRFEELGDAERQMLVDMVVEQGSRLQAIVDQVLLASQIDQGNLAIGSERVDALALVADVLDGVDRTQRPRVELATSPVPPASGDAGMTRQVVANLVDNALKYSEGSVRLGVASEGGRVRITIADDGPGIPVAERDRVFEKFYRLDPDLKAGISGTGLGLYVTRELVTRMGGRIGFLEAVRGTTIYVDLPAAG